ncbi:signal peptidase II [Chloroflexota bacterium]
MLRVNFPRGKWFITVFFLTALLVVAADLASKDWIRSYSEGQIIFEAGIFRIIHVHNSGGVFGLFQGQFLPLVIFGFIGTTLVLLFVFFLLPRSPFLDAWLTRIALGLILSGTIGNLTDRLRFGYVTDFISIGIWPVFNVADSATTVGATIFIIFLLFSTSVRKHLQSGALE